MEKFKNYLKNLNTKEKLIIASGICAVLIALGIAFAVNGIKQVTCKHIWNEGKTITEPTCAVEGEYEYECEKCGKTDVKTLDKVACAMSTMLTVEAKEATCTEDGHTKYTICTVCNEYAGSEPEITEALGHNEVNSQQEEIPKSSATSDIIVPAAPASISNLPSLFSVVSPSIAI